MITPSKVLTDDELRLLKAVAAHAKTNVSNAHLEVQRIVYGFKTNLADYSESITDPTEKARWETALKGLVTRGLLRHIAAGNQCWTYAVTDEGFAEARRSVSDTQ